MGEAALVTHACITCGHETQREVTDVCVYFMLDCHLFVRLEGSPEQMVEKVASRLREPPYEDRPYTYGMLCPVIVMIGRDEIRIGQPVHTRSGSDEDIAAFRERALPWIEELKTNKLTADFFAATPQPTGGR